MTRVSSGEEALEALASGVHDAVFLDIRMPGIRGLEMAAALEGVVPRPAVVLVTTYDDPAVSSVDLDTVDNRLKPVRLDRLAEAVRRLTEGAVPSPGLETPADECIAVALGGVTRFVSRSDVRFVEAHGDYARLFTANGSHLLRVPLATLEERWRDAGFVRIHRRHLVSLAHVDEVRMDSGHASVRLGERVLSVSRRHHRDLRELLARRAGLGRRSPRTVPEIPA